MSSKHEREVRAGVTHLLFKPGSESKVPLVGRFLRKPALYLSHDTTKGYPIDLGTTRVSYGDDSGYFVGSANVRRLIQIDPEGRVTLTTITDGRVHQRPLSQDDMWDLELRESLLIEQKNQ